MRRARPTIAILTLMYGALVGCGSASSVSTPTPTPAPASPIAAPATDTPTAAPVPPTTTRLPTLTPGQGGTLVPPSLHEIQPPEASPGQEVRVIGSGGYEKLANGGYNESSRNFPLLFDGEPIGTIGCYVNRCEGQFTIPADTTPGPHPITVEGGTITVMVR